VKRWKADHPKSLELQKQRWYQRRRKKTITLDVRPLRASITPAKREVRIVQETEPVSFDELEGDPVDVTKPHRGRRAYNSTI
jgi:hypothetical protein